MPIRRPKSKVKVRPLRPDHPIREPFSDGDGIQFATISQQCRPTAQTHLWNCVRSEHIYVFTCRTGVGLTSDAAQRASLKAAEMWGALIGVDYAEGLTEGRECPTRCKYYIDSDKNVSAQVSGSVVMVTVTLAYLCYPSKETFAHPTDPDPEDTGALPLTPGNGPDDDDILESGTSVTTTSSEGECTSEGNEVKICATSFGNDTASDREDAISVAYLHATSWKATPSGGSFAVPPDVTCEDDCYVHFDGEPTKEAPTTHNGSTTECWTYTFGCWPFSGELSADPPNHKMVVPGNVRTHPGWVPPQGGGVGASGMGVMNIITQTGGRNVRSQVVAPMNALQAEVTASDWAPTWDLGGDAVASFYNPGFGAPVLEDVVDRALSRLM